MTWTTLSKILNQLPNQTTWQQRCRLLHIHNHWRDWVGDSVAQQSEPEAVVKGTLYVNVSSPVWASALTFERLRLLEKINQHLRQAHLLPVDDIRFSTAKWTSQRITRQSSQPDLANHPSWYKVRQTQSKIEIKPKLEVKPRISLTHLKTHSGNVPANQLKRNLPQKVNSHSLKSEPKLSPPSAVTNIPDPPVPALPPVEPTAKTPAKPPENALEALERWRKLVKEQEAALIKCPQCQRHCPQGEVNRWRMCRVCATYKLFR